MLHDLRSKCGLCLRAHCHKARASNVSRREVTRDPPGPAGRHALRAHSTASAPMPLVHVEVARRSMLVPEASIELRAGRYYPISTTLDPISNWGAAHTAGMDGAHGARYLIPRTLQRLPTGAERRKSRTSRRAPSAASCLRRSKRAPLDPPTQAITVR
jgi:hypothetical protein